MWKSLQHVDTDSGLARIARRVVWYHPAAFAIAKRDVVGAWLVCLAIACLFFGAAPAFESAVEAGTAVATVGWFESR